MKRRNFLRMMVGGIAVAAAERTFPFRVFSFPKEVVGPQVINGIPYYASTATVGAFQGLSRRDPIWFLHPTQYAEYQKLYRELLETNVMPDFSQFMKEKEEVACHSQQLLKA